MASDLKHLTEKTEKLSIDPIYDTNWCDMPAEIKLECIGKMEFKERLSLRCTAKAERSLVDSQKIEFAEGRLWGNNRYLGFNLNHKRDVTKHLKDITESLEFMEYIKKVGVFENLTIYLRGSFTDNEQFITDDGFFTAKNIKFERCNIDNVVAVLRKLKNGVESIEVNREITTSDEFAKLLAISHVQNSPYWHIQDYERTDSLHKVAQMWIDTNSKIGSTFQVTVLGDGSFDEFLEHFTDRIVSKNDKRVRVRTNDPDHNILLERGLDEVITITSYLQFFRLMVISAKMKDSEYDYNCKEWIFKMDPWIYDEYHSQNDEYDSESSFEESEADRYVNELAYQEYLESKGFYDAEGI
ncbi:unnamed protein product [Caenorhabditis nigoni]